MWKLFYQDTYSVSWLLLLHIPIYFEESLEIFNVVEQDRLYTLKAVKYIQHFGNFISLLFHSWNATLYSHFTVHLLLYLTIQIANVKE